MLQTMKDNKDFLTRQEIVDENKAKDYQVIMGLCPHQLSSHTCQRIY